MDKYVFRSLQIPRRIFSLIRGSRSQSARTLSHECAKQLQLLPPGVREFVERGIRLCLPSRVHVCDGTDQENVSLLQRMTESGQLEALPQYENCWLARTDPADVARVESRTFIVTSSRRDTVPVTRRGCSTVLGNWMSEEAWRDSVSERFPGCMRGRTMYVIPFSLGAVAGPLSRVGVQLTDSAYVVVSMRIMTRMGAEVCQYLHESGDTFVKCVHSVGAPIYGDERRDGPKLVDGNASAANRGAKALSARSSHTSGLPHWPCNPESTIITHVPSTREIFSYGSGYGGNSLLGKKCFALRIASTMARDEGWLAEHMLIISVTNELTGRKLYMAAAFPSACGKTNLAMLSPPNEYLAKRCRVRCIGDDIAWMRFDDQGQLRAINPENGFFGVAPGTSRSTNPVAMETIERNTIFTNVAKTSTGGFYWEGLDSEIPSNMGITDWHGDPWTPGGGSTAAHPNSRFCTPASQCPTMDPAWQDPEGVPISAILFGGRRPLGVPLVYEALDWTHGVLIGAMMRSEATAAAEHKTKKLMNDPFAMRPFFGYNFGHYLSHWLSLKDRRVASTGASVTLPRIFHVNWFRKDHRSGTFLWPGFGENCRVLDWICRRVDNTVTARDTPLGQMPHVSDLCLDGLEAIDFEQLFSVPDTFWREELAHATRFLDEQVGEDMPFELVRKMDELRERFGDVC